MGTPWIKRIIAIAVIASLTSGCAMYRLEELRQATPTGTDFQKALAKLYMELATQDEKGYDWFNSWYFADKGLRAAYGKDVPPEDLKNWNIPKEALPDLQKAHGDLLVALSPQDEQMHPEVAAEAQFYFDCWVQRQEENWQTDRIAYCRSGFVQAIASLNATPEKETSKGAAPKPKRKHHEHKAEERKTETAKPAAAPKPAEKPKEKPKAESKPEHEAEAAETMSFVVFFTDKQPVITGAGAQVLDDVIKSLEGVADYEVVLKSGAGSDSASKLFIERTAAVTKRLVDGGIRPDAIMIGKAKGTAAKHIEIFISQ